MSSGEDAQTRRKELGKFLRDRRAKVSPHLAGIPVRGRRRARGLLREEVAAIAGVSVTWYTWLEQGRPTNPSARTLDGLCDALRLTHVERVHLYRLARPDLNPHTSTDASEALSVPLLALLEGLAPHPAYAINARWQVLACNQPAERVFGSFAQLEVAQRNVLCRLLFDPAWQALFVDYDQIVEDAVAQFRAATVHLAAEESMKQFIAELSAASPRFKRSWELQNVARARAVRKTLKHPRAGVLSFDYATLRPDGTASDIRFTIYTPADPLTRSRLVHLLAHASCLSLPAEAAHPSLPTQAPQVEQ